MQGKLLRQVLDKMMTRVLDACLKVPKLYEGSCIRELVANGLKLEPRTQGWINSEEFLSKLGA
jgi:hypothetical protein